MDVQSTIRITCPSAVSVHCHLHEGLLVSMSTTQLSSQSSFETLDVSSTLGAVFVGKSIQLDPSLNLEISPLTLSGEVLSAMYVFSQYICAHETH